MSTPQHILQRPAQRPAMFTTRSQNNPTPTVSYVQQASQMQQQQQQFNYAQQQQMQQQPAQPAAPDVKAIVDVLKQKTQKIDELVNRVTTLENEKARNENRIKELEEKHDNLFAKHTEMAEAFEWFAEQLYSQKILKQPGEEEPVVVDEGPTTPDYLDEEDAAAAPPPPPPENAKKSFRGAPPEAKQGIRLKSRAETEGSATKKRKLDHSPRPRTPSPGRPKTPGGANGASSNGDVPRALVEAVGNAPQPANNLYGGSQTLQPAKKMSPKNAAATGRPAPWSVDNIPSTWPQAPNTAFYPPAPPFGYQSFMPSFFTGVAAMSAMSQYNSTAAQMPPGRPLPKPRREDVYTTNTKVKEEKQAQAIDDRTKTLLRTLLTVLNFAYSMSDLYTPETDVRFEGEFGFSMLDETGKLDAEILRKSSQIMRRANVWNKGPIKDESLRDAIIQDIKKAAIQKEL